VRDGQPLTVGQVADLVKEELEILDTHGKESKLGDIQKGVFASLTIVSAKDGQLREANELVVAGQTFAGAATLLALYGVLLWRAFRVALLSRDPFGTYLAAGIASMLALQMFVNVGMNVGIMPITGIPLPFLSYGGSSMLASCIGVGILLNVHMRRFK
jgi:hypothetical protein